RPRCARVLPRIAVRRLRRPLHRLGLPLKQLQIRVAPDELLHAGARELDRELFGVAAPLAAADDADAERRMAHARSRRETAAVVVGDLLAAAVVDDRSRRDASHRLRRAEQRARQALRNFVAKT